MSTTNSSDTLLGYLRQTENGTANPVSKHEIIEFEENNPIQYDGPWGDDYAKWLQQNLPPEEPKASDQAQIDYSSVDHRQVVLPSTNPTQVAASKQQSTESSSKVSPAEDFKQKSNLHCISSLLEHWRNALPEDTPIEFITHLEELSHIFAGIDGEKVKSVGFEDFGKLLTIISDNPAAIPEIYYLYDVGLRGNEYCTSACIHFGNKLYSLLIEIPNKSVQISSGYLYKEDKRTKIKPSHFAVINYDKNSGKVAAKLTLNPEGVVDTGGGKLDSRVVTFNVAKKTTSQSYVPNKSTRELHKSISKYRLDQVRALISKAIGNIDLEEEPGLEWALDLLIESEDSLPQQFTAGSTNSCRDYERDDLFIDTYFETEGNTKYGVLHQLKTLYPTYEERDSYIIFTKNGVLEFTFTEDTASDSPSRTIKMDVLHIEHTDDRAQIVNKGSISVKEYKNLVRRQVIVTPPPSSIIESPVTINIDNFTQL